MGFQHRKLMSDSINETSKYDCNDCHPYCLSYCYAICSNICPLPNSPYMYPPPPPPFSVQKISPEHIVIALFSVVFFLVVCFHCYVKSLSNRRRRLSLPVIAGPIIDHPVESINTGAPIIDHPVEHINTGGLQPSVIDLIAVLKYKQGEGIVEGTDCSVCLNEFKENETLRLLPNCSHAFHVPCIDTWFKSHTTCPMCRAPIVLNEGNTGPSKS